MAESAAAASLHAWCGKHGGSTGDGATRARKVILVVVQRRGDDVRWKLEEGFFKMKFVTT